MTTIIKSSKTIRHLERRGVASEIQVQDLKWPKWPRVILLCVLAYEGAGALVGGVLLVVAPDGRLMDMPVEIMHGVFKDFLIPGIILFLLGLLNSAAFLAVLRRRSYDWLTASSALTGMFIWFTVEIIILQELHWLHLMWGLPVLVGFTGVIPLIVSRHENPMTTTVLLTCGILSSLWYVVINIIVPLQDPAYSVTSQTISELSAIGAETRLAWVLLCTPYPLLFLAFGWGIYYAMENRWLRLSAVVIIFYCILNFYWPPMHQREIISSGGGTLTDTMHLVWAMMTLVLMLLIMAFGAAGLNNAFRIFTVATYAIFIVFGILVADEAPGIDHNFPTPTIGIWERINIAAFMVWTAVFAIALLKIEKKKLEARLT